MAEEGRNTVNTMTVNASVEEQIRQQLSAQLEPQGWHIVHLQEQALTAHHSYLLIQPHKKEEVFAVYVAAFASELAQGFRHWCKIYAFKDGQALPLEWWGEWT